MQTLPQILALVEQRTTLTAIKRQLETRLAQIIAQPAAEPEAPLVARIGNTEEELRYERRRVEKWLEATSAEIRLVNAILAKQFEEIEARLGKDFADEA